MENLFEKLTDIRKSIVFLKIVVIYGSWNVIKQQRNFISTPTFFI